MYLFILEHSLLYIITLLTSTVLLCRVFIIYRKCVRRKRRKEKEKERKKKKNIFERRHIHNKQKKKLSFLINIIQPIKMSLFLQSHSYTLCNQSKWNTTTFIFSNNTFFFFFWERIIKEDKMNQTESLYEKRWELYHTSGPLVPLNNFIILCGTTNPY